MAWAKNGTPSTLTGAADVITISDLTAKKFNVILLHDFPANANNIRELVRFNNNTNSVYAYRLSEAGAADLTYINQPEINYGMSASSEFHVSYVCSITGQEKLMIDFGASTQTTGAGNAPLRREQVGKFVPSPDAGITRVDITNTDTGDYAIGTNLSALGTTGDEVFYNIQNGTVFEETDTNKSFIFNSSTGAWTQF